MMATYVIIVKTIKWAIIIKTIIIIIIIIIIVIIIFIIIIILIIIIIIIRDSKFFIKLVVGSVENILCQNITDPIIIIINNLLYFKNL